MIPDPAAVAAFWTWFASNNAAIRAMPNADAPFWDTVLAQLKRVHKGLAFEMSDEDRGIRDFVLTAQSDRRLFPLIDAMIAAAPPRRGWTFTALKPAMGFDFVTDYEGVKFDPKSMWFLPLNLKDHPAHLGLRIGIPRLRDQDHDAADFASRIILETALGERAAATDIRHIEVAALPSQPEKAGYIELPELPAYLKWRKSKLTAG
jgi:hypothetical protein